MARSGFLALLFPLLGSVGCAQHLPAGTREIAVAQYAFGAFGGAALDLRDVCPNGEVREFEVRRDAGAYLASFVSLGFYLPHRIRVRCTPASKR